MATLGAAMYGLDTTLAEGVVQDAHATTFIAVVLAILCPVFSAISGLCIFMFPIRGDRLTELENKQGDVFKKLPDGNTKVTPANPSKSPAAETISTSPAPI